jgi:hypothetical protein
MTTGHDANRHQLRHKWGILGIEQASRPLTGSSDRVSYMTNITRIKQGLTTSFEDLLKMRADPSHRPGPQVRHVDNLRWALQQVQLDLANGGETPLNDIATIHYARWVILPGDEYLLFTSNFDGGFEQYIHDFATIANSGRHMPDNAQGTKFMDLIWGNCEGYPGTGDFRAFLDYIADHNVDTTLFYATITSTTVRDVEWLRQARATFVEFDRQAQAIPRAEWPPSLLQAYDGMKSALNRLEVSVV